MRYRPPIRRYLAPGRPYPRPPQRYPAVYQAAPAGINKTTKIVICAVVTVIVLLGVIAIALGVGLGVGLNKSSSSSGSSSSCSCGCAASNVNSTVGRVIGGSTTTPNSWPWIVAIYNDGSFTCGGALISYNHVLTAAHCVVDTTASSLTVFAGVHKLGERNFTLMRTVSNVWSHPSYDAISIDYDIAVLKLSSAFTQSSTVGLACLPSASSSVPTIGQNGMLIGWGKTSSTATITDDSTLQQVILEVHNSTVCALNNKFDRQVCAGYGTTGACNGDSGGPLNTNVNDAWTVTGVVSYGRSDCGSRTVFTRVSYYRSLIDTQMQTL